ncbi:hypothetical protein ACM39_03610 [Chryseobacterium sp. FH2]|nr:hypothetical protein ACM39_03610 [Chryseobacterium sp. FH2]
MHSLELYHSFDIDGDYTFKQSSEDFDGNNDTDNVIDYSSTRTLIWYWQNLKVKKTSNNKLIKDI